MNTLKLHWPEILLAALGLAAFAVLVINPLRWPVQAEPSYLGKPLSAWVRQLDATNSQAAQQAIEKIGSDGLRFVLRSNSKRSNTQVRTTAVMALLGTRALPALGKALDDWDDSVRLAAVRAVDSLLPKLADRIDLVMPGLIRRLTDPDPDVHLAALRVLDHIGPSRVRAVPALVATLREMPPTADDAETELLQQMTARLLGLSGAGGQAAVPVLSNLLHQADGSVREQAALALWEITHDPGLVVPAMTKMLGETNTSNPRLAALVLSRIKNDGS